MDELRDAGWADHEIGDKVETLIKRQYTDSKIYPAGTKAEVVELSTSDLGGGVTVRFEDGELGYYFGDHLRKV